MPNINWGSFIAGAVIAILVAAFLNNRRRVAA